MDRIDAVKIPVQDEFTPFKGKIISIQLKQECSIKGFIAGIDRAPGPGPECRIITFQVELRVGYPIIVITVFEIRISGPAFP
jgi:hypothetical protein